VHPLLDDTFRMCNETADRLRLVFLGAHKGPATNYLRGTIDFPRPGAPPGPSSWIEAPTATDVLDVWNAVRWWAAYEPQTFRERIIGLCGANDPRRVEEPIELPASDEEILEAVVEAAGPDRLRLERANEPPPPG
jgi:hypothetical protein